MNFYNSKNFQLDVELQKSNLNLKMRLFTPFVDTNHIPKTKEYLEKNLPVVLASKCFNEKDLPFKEELKNTEIAHLFEHILLEYLCDEKVEKGSFNVSFSGRTYWDKDKKNDGTFEILVNVSKEDESIVEPALKKSISLVEDLLEEGLKNEATGRMSATCSF